MNKIYISDLDMTLLDSNANLSRFSKTNINNFVNKGIKFTVASARSVKSIQRIFEGVDLELPVIEFNGAYISKLKTGKHIVTNAIERPVLDEIRDGLRNSDTNYFLSTFDGRSDKLHYAEARNAGEQWYVKDRIKNNDPRLNRTKSLNLHFDEDVVCITIIDTKENLGRLIEGLCIDNSRVETNFQENMYSPGWHWLTIHSKLATKDKAIDCLLKQCNMVDAEVVAFGDNKNDIKMLKYASIAIAVENACSELKEVADIITGKNDDDCVVRYIAEDNNMELLGTNEQE